MAEETLYDSATKRRLAGIELGDDGIPKATRILNFRHLLERHGLSEATFADVQKLLSWRKTKAANQSQASATALVEPLIIRSLKESTRPKKPILK